MYLTPYQKKQIKFVLVLLLGIPATVFAVYKGVQYLSQATGDPTPQGVVISNITPSSVTLSWVTQKEVEAYVIPVSNGVEHSPVPDKRGEGKRLNHYVELRGLEPDTQYSFVLLSDGEQYSSGVSGTYRAKTAPFGTETVTPNPVYGTVEGSSTLEDVIVYILPENKSAFPMSTTVASSGNWLGDLSLLRGVEKIDLFKTSKDTKLVILARDGMDKGVVLSGTYSQLFDSNGGLNQTYSMKLESLSNILSYLPQEAVLGSKTDTPITPPIDDTDDDDDPIPPVDDDDDDPTPPVDDDTEYTGPYTIKSDVVWENLTSSTSTSGLDSGEDTVMITNVTDVGFTVVWVSDQDEEGYIKYGTSKTELNTESRDYRDGLVSMNEYSSHLILSDRLQSETTYYFEIYSGDEKYDNGGELYSVTTLPTLVTAPPFDTRSGTIVNSSELSDWVVVFKLIDSDEEGSEGSSRYFATLPDEEGSINFIIGDIRTELGDEYFSYSNSDILQSFFLGAESKRFDFSLAEEEIEMDVSEIGGSTVTGSVKLLSDYGIIDLR